MTLSFAAATAAFSLRNSGCHFSVPEAVALRGIRETAALEGLPRAQEVLLHSSLLAAPEVEGVVVAAVDHGTSGGAAIPWVMAITLGGGPEALEVESVCWALAIAAEVAQALVPVADSGAPGTQAVVERVKLMGGALDGLLRRTSPVRALVA